MRIEVTAGYEELSAVAAHVVARQVLLNPKSVLGLPTGDTPKRMYERLAAMHRMKLVDLSQITTFNLDEFIGIPPTNPMSFRAYMQHHFFRPIRHSKDQTHFPDGQAEDLDQECSRYEKAISDGGGLDLAVVGIGQNGHIAFNEPGADWHSETRPVRLSEETIQRLAQDGDPASVPREAITVGIKTLMSARRILLLASGEAKAQIVCRALGGPASKQVPASVLQLHPAATAILDHGAASILPRSTPIRIESATSI